ncbi:mitochondrial hypoxia responsive domain-containing protein [Biscogniauxia mediterranea]|nr:mitochondrial hypoxia responsive domain-containing protein [Biscogniauxia mediterranea]
MSDRPMPSSFDDDREYNETGFQKLSRKLREEPLIPLGSLLTCLALYNAWAAMRRGDHKQVQRMFRARIGAQAFTVMAMVAGGAYYGADRDKRRELIKLEAQQRAQERHQKWLHELEVRDEEDKQLRAAVRRKRERVELRRERERESNAKAEAEADADAEKTDAGAGAEPKQKQEEVGTDTGDAKTKGKSTGGGQVSQEEGKSGSGVLGALSEAGGGWFGAKKGEKGEGGGSKKPAGEKKPGEKGPEEKQTEAEEAPKK